LGNGRHGKKEKSMQEVSRGGRKRCCRVGSEYYSVARAVRVVQANPHRASTFDLSSALQSSTHLPFLPTRCWAAGSRLVAWLGWCSADSHLPAVDLFGCLHVQRASCNGATSTTDVNNSTTESGPCFLVVSLRIKITKSFVKIPYLFNTGMLATAVQIL
jgi:hypothetical protein